MRVRLFESRRGEVVRRAGRMWSCEVCATSRDECAMRVRDAPAVDYFSPACHSPAMP